MKHTKHDNRVGAKHEDNSIRKAIGKHATHFGLSTQAWKLPRRHNGAFQGLINLSKKFKTEPVR